LRAQQALIVDDVVYLSNFGLTTTGSATTSIISAVDLTTNKVLWNIEERPRAAMTSDGNHLYVLTDSGIVAISTTDGSRLWQTSVDLASSHEGDEILARDGWVFFTHSGGNTSELYALNAQTGSIVWTNSLTVAADPFKPVAGPAYWDKYSVMVYDHGTLYVRMLGSRVMLIALDARDGHKLWDFSFDIAEWRGEGPPGAASSPAFTEQALYFGAFGGTFYALQRDTGKVLWKHQVDVDLPVYIDDQIIAISSYQNVGALDAQTGDLKWTVPFINGGIGTLSPFIFSNGYLFFYSGDSNKGQLSAIDLKSGRIVFTLQPAFSNGCDTLFPVAFVLSDDNLELVTLNCVSRFQISWKK
jgi:outer membrane protein assembly factor BamB